LGSKSAKQAEKRLDHFADDFIESPVFCSEKRPRSAKKYLFGLYAVDFRCIWPIDADSSILLSRSQI
jgi:hypothetical protein